ncbi:bile acid:sodium symporter family protein [Sphingorhabdus sp. Alg239-R122]|uniref:bile acid:sodium symporter family protein n=1 Tax=Sphingorhabdus sp. Alg239-R122 TaxID=2305989 RepID=UPI001F0830F1|nr:bile acid:sodium symporter family protein [Sphingorhabdus sp. Alg239-R122]
MLKRLVPDNFVLVLLGTIVLASLLPVSGAAAGLAELISAAAIFLLFFLHGLRLPRADVLTAMRNWRLQCVIFLFVFAAMPVAGQVVAPIAASFLPAIFVTGLVYLTILPSTVQSAISYSSIAGGNVAASVMASAVLNLSAIFATPLLVVLLIGGAGNANIGSDVVIKIAAIVLLPFAIGQIAQGQLGAWAAQRKSLLSFMDKSAIAIAVYVAFSASVVAGLWSRVDMGTLVILTGFIALLLAFAFCASWLLGKILNIPRPDHISLIFAGSHKSIATGAPLAAILFAGPEAGTIILPALIYHQLQLIISAPVAARLAGKGLQAT